MLEENFDTPFKIKHDQVSLTYFQNINDNLQNNFHKTPWAGILLRNSDQWGTLLEFSNINEYETFRKETKQEFWLNLQIKLFNCDVTENSRDVFAIFLCPECPTMKAVKEYSFYQEFEVLESKLCVHSRTACMLVGNWKEAWEEIIMPTNITDQYILNRVNDGTNVFCRLERIYIALGAP